MPQSTKKRSFIIIIIVCAILIALMVFTSENRRSNMTSIEGFLGELIRPVQKLFYTINSSVYSLFAGIGDNINMKADYISLQKQVEDLEKELLNKQEIEKQNQRLKELLDFSKENEDFVVTGARVIGKNEGGWFNVIVIDKGKNHGVDVNMAVVTGKGLVGRVFQVGSNWAKVRTIVDGQSGVSAIVERTRDNGLVKGNNSIGDEDGMCRMVFLPTDSDLIEGDKVITSGLGEIFPKGIYIGEVKKVVKEKRDFFKTATIEPGVDFKRLEEVLVIKHVHHFEETE